MLLFAMALAAPQLPPFDPALALAGCIRENDPNDFDAQSDCFEGLNRDYRELTVLYRYAKPALKAAIETCVAMNEDAGSPDWNHIEICANDDAALLMETQIPERALDMAQARARCAAQLKERPDTLLKDCLKDETVSYRNFALFKAAYPDASLQAAFRICQARWTDGGLPSWGMISFCAQDQLDAFEQLAPHQAAARTANRQRPDPDPVPPAAPPR